MYIKLNEQNIYFQKIGRGNDLIILHGWGQDVSSFWGVIEELKKDFTVWLLDLPGFGRSDVPKKDFTVSDYAEVVYEFIKQQKISKPVLLGHSVGGRIGIVLAAKHPEVISKLILEDSAGIKPKRDLFKYLIYPFAKVVRYLLPNIFGIKEKLRYKFYKGLESDYINAGALEGTLTNILKEDLISYLPKIKTDTLLIWGAKDQTLEASPENAKKMYRLIPNSRLEFLDGVGHFPHLENAKMFLYFVKDFAS